MACNRSWTELQEGWKPHTHNACHPTASPCLYSSLTQCPLSVQLLQLPWQNQQAWILARRAVFQLSLLPWSWCAGFSTCFPSHQAWTKGTIFLPCSSCQPFIPLPLSQAQLVPWPFLTMLQSPSGDHHRLSDGTRASSVQISMALLHPQDKNYFPCLDILYLRHLTPLSEYPHFLSSCFHHIPNLFYPKYSVALTFAAHVPTM